MSEHPAAYLRCIGCKVSPFGESVAVFVEKMYRKIHLFPMPERKMRQLDWNDDCTFTWTHWGSLDTFDGEGLTHAVFLAHDMGMRLSVKGIGPGYMRMMLHKRDVPNTVSGSAPHPTLEESVAWWRARNPARER